MASRIRVFLLRAVLGALLISVITGCAGRQAGSVSGSTSQAVIEPEVERRDVKVADIDSEDFEIGAYYGIKSVEDFETNAVYGARLAYHVSESLFIEGTYGKTDVGETSFEKLSGGAPLLTGSQREYTYYDLSAGFNLLPGEVFFGDSLAFSSALYVLAGAGNTDFAGDNQFTVVIGAGYRMLLKDWLATHITVRDHLFSSDILGSSKTSHNIEMTLGLTVFF